MAQGYQLLGDMSESERHSLMRRALRAKHLRFVGEQKQIGRSEGENRRVQPGAEPPALPPNEPQSKAPERLDPIPPEPQTKAPDRLDPIPPEPQRRLPSAWEILEKALPSHLRKKGA